jgi:lipopolysaccharide/colanic/teichoic acid biosynthesis glycosyltransferase
LQNALNIVSTLCLKSCSDSATPQFRGAVRLVEIPYADLQVKAAESKQGKNMMSFIHEQSSVEHQEAGAKQGLLYCGSYQKRLLDIVGAIIGLIVLMPLFALAALIVRVIDGVPPIFRQERYGYGGQPFTILKLRTLPIDEKPSAATPDRIQNKPNYATTRTGKFWRVHSIDEIIQFWLVLRGDMSLVGHRAFPVYYVPHMAQMPGMTEALIEKYLATIAQIKPGMSALSAINGRANLTLQQKIEFDLQYAERASLLFDLHILIRSVWTVITCEGAR